MYGLPQCLHLDNAAEFRSRALRMGCAQNGIELMYRPVCKPHYGAQGDRMNRTLMQRLEGPPGPTGNTNRGCKARKPAELACLTLPEFERWWSWKLASATIAANIAVCTAACATSVDDPLTLSAVRPPRQIPPGPEEAQKLLISERPSVPGVGS